MIELTLSAKRMRDYLPPYWHEFTEMNELLKSQGIELDNLNDKKDLILVDAFILEMTERRIKEWEQWLELPPTGTLQERRMRILNYFAVISKMTKQSIQAIVANLYNNARAIVTFEDSTIKVIIKPLPQNYKDKIDVSLLYNQLYERKPCHIALYSERYMSTWGEISTAFNTWNDVKNNRDTWDDVKLFILE